MFEHSADRCTREAALRDRIAELERQKSAAVAEQARLSVEWEKVRRTAEATAGVPVSKRGRGLGSEIALARRESPNQGSKLLGLAKALVHEMPHTLALLTAGLLSEWRATLIVRESACLTVEDRRRLDNELCADPNALEGFGDARITAEAKKIAYRLDPQAVVDHAAKAPKDRYVSVRPAPEGMTYVTACVPMPQGVAVYATLDKAVKTNADDRTRGQVMADTLVERITGRPAEEPVPVTVNVVLSDDTLVDGGDDAATVEGYGPVPADVARSLITDSLDNDGEVALRRLYASPAGGALVAMESKSRTFPKALAQFIRFRDDTCRTPYCNAPVRHIDHAHPAHRGGPTTAVNGQGLCEHCNYVKEQSGWAVRVVPGESGRHTAEYTTPTGAVYRSTAPPIAGGMRVLTRDIHIVMPRRAA
ncbi:DUF222 domain-containing protein [Mycobacterium hackensackense]|uniref:HNH endonuclease n=1 Tax=Mycobacterium hackensackense TaxID=228909 RepID=UPI002265F17F|nr:DUF222 domain-containing protein [Mycobacterium hackensackense]MCV7251197.1 DUF222 domain-containing protein [Mycobacterium hackensackense]